MEKIDACEFIQKFLIDDIGRMKDLFPYHAFLIMASGIEFLGKCLSNRDWNESGHSREDFNAAIGKLSAFEKYRNFDESYKLYDLLRNGLLHALAPKSTLTLSSKFEEKHLVEREGRLNLRCEDFYEDFKKACEEIINKKGYANRRFREVFLEIPTGDDVLNKNPFANSGI